MPNMAVRDPIESDVYRSVARPADDGGRHGNLLRLVTDRQFAVRVLRYALGLPTPLRTEDRRVLEQVVFPYYASQAGIRTILFVGCHWYTRHYRRAFFANREFWTLEPAREARRYGGPLHVAAPLERLDEFFPAEYFDLIICNGVYGFGLDSLEQCEIAFAHCHSRLRAQGHLLLGWTDVPARTPVPLEHITSLKMFRPFIFPALGAWRYVTDTPYAHTYDFLSK